MESGSLAADNLKARELVPPEPSVALAVQSEDTLWVARRRRVVHSPEARPDAGAPCRSRPVDPLPRRSHRGRPVVRVHPTVPCAPRTVTAFAATLPDVAWQRVGWRHGSRGPQIARFAAVRVRPAHGWMNGGIDPESLCAEAWLLLHWPDDKPAPTKAWLASLPADTAIETLVGFARLRWRVERDNREGKGLAGCRPLRGSNVAGPAPPRGVRRTCAAVSRHRTRVGTGCHRTHRHHAACDETRHVGRRRRGLSPLTIPRSPRPGGMDASPTALPAPRPHPHAARSTFEITRWLSRALARFGLPCCPTCHRANERPDAASKITSRKLDDFDLIAGWSG